MPFNKINLAWKFSFTAFIVIAAMSTVIYFVVDTKVTYQLHDEYDQKGIAIASNLATNIIDPLLINNIVQQQLLLKNTQRSNKDIIYIFVLNRKGIVQSHTFPGGFPRGLKVINNTLKKQPHSLQMIETEQGIIHDIAIPVLHGTLGTVHVGLSNKTIEEKRIKIQQHIFKTCLLAAIAAIIAAILLSRLITKPLALLATSADILGQGNLNHRVDINSNNELGIVAKAFNLMADSLQDDIEHLLTIEKALKKSEELYRSLVENINMGISLVDTDFNVIMTNAANGAMFNKSPDKFFGKKCFEVFEKRSQICSQCPGITAMETGKPQEAITTWQKDDGSRFTIKIKIFPIFDDKGENTGFIKVAEDITDFLKSEKDLAAEKERLSVTLRSIGDGVITTDVSGKVALINKVAENLTGWMQDEAFGKPLEEVFHIIDKNSRERQESPFKKVLKSGQVIGLADETILVGKNGKELNIADSAAPIHDSESSTVGVVLVFRDVTEQQKTEKELLKIKKIESIGVLAGGIAHDFNNILVAILGNINLSLMDQNLKDETRKFLKEAEKASVRAKDLTQQLLTFAKGGEPVKKTTSLAHIVKDSANFVLSGLPVTCQYDIPEGLWLVEIDTGQISQVVQNIVINAGQSMPDGGVIEITCSNVHSSSDPNIRGLGSGKFVKMAFQDHGTGIPDDAIERIFDPYFSTKKGGSGLGLAITHSIINKHGGHISVESVPGSSTTFNIYLPVSTQHISGTHKHEQEQTFSKSSSNKKIIVMDDDEMVRSVVKAILQQHGHEVLLAHDGTEAIQLYKESMTSEDLPNIIIMDLTIPGGMGGKEAVLEILALNPHAKVIVSSGYSNDPIMANYKDYGFCGAIVKPFEADELAKVVQNALG